MATTAPHIESRPSQPRPPGGVHRAVNRWLTTVALILSIIILAALILGGIRLVAAANDISNRLSELGSSSETTETESFVDPYGGTGPGLNEDGTPYVQPDDADPGSYIGPLNPDGTPCV